MLDHTTVAQSLKSFVESGYISFFICIIITSTVANPVLTLKGLTGLLFYLPSYKIYVLFKISISLLRNNDLLLPQNYLKYVFQDNATMSDDNLPFNI